MIEWLVFIATCSLEMALCQYYYDSFMFFRWGKLQRIISFVLCAAAGAGNAALFEYYFVGALYSCKSSWALFWMLGNNLIFLCLAFKIC